MVGCEPVCEVEPVEQSERRPELLTTVEVAALLKVNRSPLSRWRSAGADPGSRG